MQTNNLYFCNATETSLHILSARESEIATLHEGAIVTGTVRLRPVELRWLAYAGEQFSKLHAVALKAGAHKRHLLTILPDEPEA